jgi:dinuclear metal center YbgI/SA1388 family protein
MIQKTQMTNEKATKARSKLATPGKAGMTKASSGSVDRQTLGAWFDDTLTPQHFKDYCPNGLQIQGASRVRLLACAVTASINAIEAAREQGAQALLVHHGYFWRGEDPRLVGIKHKRIQLLLKHNINLFAFHLPLDVHPTLGNNAQMGARLGWTVDERFGDQDLICATRLRVPITAAQLAKSLKGQLKQAPLLVGDLSRSIRRIAWCTGGAQDSLQEAIDAGCDAFVSGEISERTTHLAREAGVIYAAAGHHATERFGVQALAQAASEALGVAWCFVDDPNPV